MKTITSSSLSAGILSAIIWIAASMDFASAKDGEKTYELPSLKYVHSVTLLVSGDDVSGTLSSQEYGEGMSASVKFTGTISGKTLTLKLAGDAELINIVAPNESGMHTWRIGENEGKETLFIPINARGEVKPVEMPLALKP